MYHLTVKEAKQRFAALLDAVQREPVIIRQQNREIAVILSAEEYDRLRALNVDKFDSFCDRVGGKGAVHGLTAKKLSHVVRD
jgi:antitoxin Phd